MKEILGGTDEAVAKLLTGAVENCVVLDTETTGLDPCANQIVELAFLEVRNGQICRRLVTHVRPTVARVGDSEQIHGLNEKDLINAPKFEDVARDIKSWLNNKFVVGHNVTFDLAFLLEEFNRLRPSADAFSPQPSPFNLSGSLCTAAAARRLIPRERVGGYSLKGLADQLNLVRRPTHTALSDALATLELLESLQDRC